MATVASDQARRDAQFDGRIMETATYPTASFQITRPIDFGSVPADGERRTVEAAGELTMHGVTRTVTFDVTGQLNGSTIQIVGTIPITFSDWNIPNPSFGPVTTEDSGVLEFALNLVRS
jgi:polyisoprenoid-binding protein YceI